MVETLYISPPQVLKRIFFYGMKEFIETARARANATTVDTSTRLLSCLSLATATTVGTSIIALSCMNCCTTFCMYKEHLGSVCDLNGQPFPNWFHVRQTANTRLAEGEESIYTADLGSKIMVFLNAVRCTSCDHRVGYKVIHIGEETNELREGEFIITARLS